MMISTIIFFSKYSKVVNGFVVKYHNDYFFNSEILHLSLAPCTVRGILSGSFNGLGDNAINNFIDHNKLHKFSDRKNTYIVDSCPSLNQIKEFVLYCSGFRELDDYIGHIAASSSYSHRKTDYDLIFDMFYKYVVNNFRQVYGLYSVSILGWILPAYNMWRRGGFCAEFDNYVVSNIASQAKMVRIFGGEYI